MNQRHRNAVAAQQGACNPIPLIRALQDGLAELHAEQPGGRADTPTIRTDPALRMLVHQLAYLLNTRELDDDSEVYRSLCTAIGFPGYEAAEPTSN